MVNPDKPLNVVHVTPYISRQGGGVAVFLWAVAKAGREAGINPTILAVKDARLAEDVEPLRAYVKVLAADSIGPGSLAWSPAMRQILDAQNDVQIVHSHGLRMLPQVAARKFAKRRGLPLVISPHGQLDPWVMAYGRFRKAVLHALFERRNLASAAAFHATSTQEARHVRAAGLTQPIAVIPIGIDAAPYAVHRHADEIESRWPSTRGKKKLLYLSTIYRKKNLPVLASAWRRLQKDFPGWQLIVGGQEIHPEERQIAERELANQGASDRATFIGEQSIEWMHKLFAGSDLYALPTDGENFGIAIAEAMVSGLPVITTNTTPWPVLRDQRCGWWVERGIDPLMAAMREAMSLSDEQRHEMGMKGRQWILTHHAWPAIAGQFRAFYDWLAGRGSQPSFVYSGGATIPE